jgi:hypothetical protein
MMASTIVWAMEQKVLEVAFMAGLDEQSGKRYRVWVRGENFYIWISDTDIMLFGPGEGSEIRQSEYAALFALFRMISVSRKDGTPWEKILRQLDGADAGHGKNWPADIARVIRDYIGEDKK